MPCLLAGKKLTVHCIGLHHGPRSTDCCFSIFIIYSRI
uniref:Uncharacterized protein n=1 Tax=Arundo donax TaxID=35708 RepID=A0A0A9GBK1_ARUDO